MRDTKNGVCPTQLKGFPANSSDAKNFAIRLLSLLILPG